MKRWLDFEDGNGEIHGAFSPVFGRQKASPLFRGNEGTRQIVLASSGLDTGTPSDYCTLGRTHSKDSRAWRLCIGT